MKKIFWVKISPFDKKMVSIALESGVDAIWVDDEYFEEAKNLAKVNIIGEKKGDMQVGKDLKVVKITKKEDEDDVVKIKGEIPVVIENIDWTIIPLENLISKTTNLIQSVKTPLEAKIALETMEKGADGILLIPETLNDIKETAQIIEMANNENLKLEKVKITDTKIVTMSDRCCMDTTSMLAPGEGMLIGNTASAFFLVHNENVQSPFCAARPFRVNAGAVHAYIKLPNNKTKYLCEVSSADEVLTCDKDGNTRVVAIGRNKIERRPMMLIEAESQDGRKVALVMQNAETIRLTSPDGHPVSVTKIQKGDQVLAHFGDKTGRHFGQEVKETINEK